MESNSSSYVGMTCLSQKNNTTRAVKYIALRANDKLFF